MSRSRAAGALVAALAVLSAVPVTAAPKGKAAADPAFYSGKLDPASFTKQGQERLAQVQKAVDALASAKGTRSVETTLAAFDDLSWRLDGVAGEANLIQNGHPDAAMRDAAEKLSQEVQALASRLSLNRAVYDALAAIDATGADAETRHYLTKTLRDFRLSGVAADEATRKKVQALNEELVPISQEFSRNIRSDVRKVVAKSAAELAGLPADYVSRHKPEADGSIVLTIDYPDSIPVFTYAENEDLRKRMFVEYNNRAYPANEAVLAKLVAKRHELATLLGFASYADLVTADKMVGSGKNAADFIEKVAAASRDAAAKDYERLLARKRKEVPGAERIEPWERTYWSEKLKKAEYAFDSQSVRPYFAFEKVKQGVLDTAATLFGVTFKRVPGAPVWDPSVECWEMWDGGALAGRFYLDLHPRPNKFNHAAAFPIRTGVKGKALPEAALLCNFPGGQKGDPGLMEHGDVVTFLHEFGHLVHGLFAGRMRWAGTSGISTERDFVEAPSQLLEEWAWDPATLATFAKHHETGAPIPAELVARMRRASEFGKAVQVRRQMVYAKLSLSIYDRPPAQVSLEPLTEEISARYDVFPYAKGTHFYTSFGHLDGYSATYYTYMWSLVIAKDLFSAFDRKALLSPTVSKRYRDLVLAPGGSKPAAELVTSFLGRPFRFDAWQAWLNEGD